MNIPLEATNCVVQTCTMSIKMSKSAKNNGGVAIKSNYFASLGTWHLAVIELTMDSSFCKYFRVKCETVYLTTKTYPKQGHAKEQ